VLGDGRRGLGSISCAYTPAMRFGAHLPIAGFGRERPPASTLMECAEASEALGYTTLCANDHLLFALPWTDGLVALGAAAARTKSISLMTTANGRSVQDHFNSRGSGAVQPATLRSKARCVTPASTLQ
jgi:hypothetical protein